jgi:hypothetical protein
MPKVNWKEIGIVSGCGAVGGLLAWLIAAVNVGVDAAWGLSLAASVLGGAVAAGAGVYLLANTDTKQAARCIFFSVFCGVSWQPIVETAKNLANDATANKDLAAAQKQVESSLQQAAAGGPAADITPLVDGAKVIAEKLPAATRPALRQDAFKTLEKAFSQIRQSSAINPERAVTALEAIGQRGAASGSSAAKGSARDALRVLRDEHSPTQQTWIRADSAIQALK